MATLSHTIATNTPFNTTFLPKTPKLSSLLNKQTQNPPSTCNKISCKLPKNNNPQQSQNPTNSNPPFSLDRRNMLIGLGGITLTSNESSNNVLADPIAPDVTKCSPTAADWDGSVGDQCCPPAFDLSKTLDFKFENYPNPVTKIRRPAHLAMKDPNFLNDYNNAIAAMKKLPDNDPRSFMQQARIHCAYCDGAYPVVGYSDDRLEVHTTWLFASFHRWYLYFFERIMGKLIGNPKLGLPYWNWDHPDGMRIPEMFNDVNSPLYDAKRNQDHLTKVIDLAYNRQYKETGFSDEKQTQENLLLVRKQVLYQTKPELFFGAKYVGGDEGQFNSSNAGALERMPHNNVHIWTGQKDIGQDMGRFWSSGRDPLFYCHHSNVDRMWSIWKNDLPGSGRVELDENDYLNAYFFFYDENANPVKVYVRDSFDTEKLGYKYEKQELLWLKPVKISSTQTTKPQVKDQKISFPKPLDSVIKTKVERPKKSTSDKAKEEVLVIKFDLGMFQEYIQFDVFINDSIDHKPDEKTTITPEYAGSFTSLSHREGKMSKAMKGKKPKKSKLKLAISTILEDIGAANDDALLVTIVPKSGTTSVVITGIKIEFKG